MERIKNYLLGSAVLIITALALTLTTDVRRAVADEFKDVLVINTEGMPANVRDVGIPLRSPVHIRVNTTIDFGETSGEQQVYTVPPGKRLVVEHVSLVSGQIHAGNGVGGSISSRFGGEIFSVPLDLRAQAKTGLSDGPLYVVNAPALFFADPGQVVTVRAELNEPQGTSNGFFSVLLGTLTGHLEEITP